MEEAIRTIYPQSHAQRCMVHLVRNSLRFIPTKHYNAFCRDVKAVYEVVSLSAAWEALEALVIHQH
ncbi:transposase [Eubacteriales bacterium OttesenSCG-928-A19]|nr:transposase [Eubacteriales bacterium OttesenSCG-928-A19]